MPPSAADSPQNDRVKLGLALSGGGFRAAFFHIGVLARMAEMGLLRHVEVISTVSGGSIVGALYYLHVKRLLETKPDAEIADADYADIVAAIVDQFFAGTQRNLRARTFADLRHNVKMNRRTYSRSDRIGELYDEFFYSDFRERHDEPIEMRELKIGEFDPEADNPSRSAKVPILLLNATVLNDGHAWRFEAARMGEPGRGPGAAAVDPNMVLRRAPSYADIVPHQQDFPLGIAVAASACFPAFPPLAISDLYPSVRVQLVDGGVFDNQGVWGLYQAKCSHLVVSDGSGLMADADNPPGSVVGALFRDFAIQADRIRDVQLSFIEEDPRAAVVHLRRGLGGREVPWLRADCTPAPPPPPEEPQMLSFGVDRDIQELLSRVRTDLDAFSETEAMALMCDAYKMSEEALAPNPEIVALAEPAADRARGPWRFEEIEPWLSAPTPDFRKRLEVARGRFLKAPKLDPWLWLPLAALLCVLVVAVGLAWDRWLEGSVPLGSVLLGALVVGGIAVLPALVNAFRPLRFLSGPLDELIRRTLWLALPFIPWAIVQLQLRLFDPSFRRRGRVSTLTPPG
ncbi:MAG TPA: patatin-like phospholipase family protein [Solirubrobacterales bacterium]|nr:patatin-like phospholipase family protein [Solirubrobacterales bacterium]